MSQLSMNHAHLQYALTIMLDGISRQLQQVESDVQQIIQLSKGKYSTQRERANSILKLYVASITEIFNRPFMPGYSLLIFADHELPMEKLNYDTTRYSIDWDEFSLQRGERVLDTSRQSIFIDDILMKQAQSPIPPSVVQVGISLDDYAREHWADFTVDKIKSKDLLDQLFCVHVIKMARDGNQEARKSIDQALKVEAHKLAHIWYKMTANAWNKEPSNLAEFFTISNTEVYAQYLVGRLLYGDAPEDVKNMLDSTRAKLMPSINRRVAKLIMTGAETAIREASQSIELAKKVCVGLKGSSVQEFCASLNMIYDLVYYASVVVDPLTWLYPRRALTKTLQSKPVMGVSQNSKKLAPRGKIALKDKQPDYLYNTKVYRFDNEGNPISYLFGSKKSNFPGRVWLELNNFFRLMRTSYPMTNNNLSYDDSMNHESENSPEEYGFFDEDGAEEEEGPQIETDDHYGRDSENGIKTKIAVCIDRWSVETNPSELYVVIVRARLLSGLTNQKTEVLIKDALKRRQIQRIVKEFKKWAKENCR